MKVAILGATSAIASEVAKLYAAEGASLFLVGRDAARLAAVAPSAQTLLADLADTNRHAAILDAAGDIDVILIAHGVLDDQRAIDSDVAAQLASWQINATATISLCAHAANKLIAQKRGTLAVIGSVAGDRGRRSNYTYGAAKAAVAAYCEGLTGRLAEAGCHLVLIKPGWVDTPMTKSFKKNALYASPRSVAKSIHHAIAQHKKILYTPWFWWWISTLLRMLPEPLTRRL